MNYPCYVDETDYKRFESKKEILLRLAQIEQLGISVLDTATNRFLLYVPPNYSEWDERMHKEFEQQNNLAYILSFLNANDRQFAVQTQQLFYNFLCEQPQALRKDYNLLLDFWVLHAKGYYYRVVHQSNLLEHDRQGNIWLLYCKLILIDKQVKYQPARRHLIHTPTKKAQFFKGCKGENWHFLTKQELDISKLTTMGLESQHIADKLHISNNTVRNHKQHILLKTATNSMPQAIHYLQKVGLI